MNSIFSYTNRAVLTKCGITGVAFSVATIFRHPAGVSEMGFQWSDTTEWFNIDVVAFSIVM